MSDVQRIEDMVTYCPLTGVFRWKTFRHKRNAKVGDIAGAVDRQGYFRLRTNGKVYMGHRVAWRIMTGEWPPQQVDHKNLVKSDNRWENLRLATQSQNQANRAPGGKYPKGVRKNSTGGLFAAMIGCNGVRHYLGSFPTPELAGAAYEAAAKLMFGEFARTAKSPHAQFEFAVLSPQEDLTANSSPAPSLAPLPAAPGSLPFGDAS